MLVEGLLTPLSSKPRGDGFRPSRLRCFPSEEKGRKRGRRKEGEDQVSFPHVFWMDPQSEPDNS